MQLDTLTFFSIFMSTNILKFNLIPINVDLKIDWRGLGDKVEKS